MKALSLWSGACALALACQTVSAQSAGPAAPTYEVRGHVLDGSRRPLELVEVLLIRDGAIVHTVVSGSGGRYTFGRIGPGPVTLHFRRLGYAAQTMDLLVGPGGHPAAREIVLVELPSQLEEVEVSTSSGGGKLRGFHERRQQRAAFARFLEQGEIRRIGPANSSDLFRTVPGITIRASSVVGNTIRVRGCQPMVLVDGQRVPGAELDEVIRPDEIGAIEFYTSSAGVPAQYMERGNRLCGLILVWAK